MNIKKLEKPWAILLRISKKYDSSDSEKSEIKEKFKCINDDNAIIFLKSNKRKL